MKKWIAAIAVFLVLGLAACAAPAETHPVNPYLPEVRKIERMANQIGRRAGVQVNYINIATNREPSLQQGGVWTITVDWDKMHREIAGLPDDLTVTDKYIVICSPDPSGGDSTEYYFHNPADELESPAFPAPGTYWLKVFYTFSDGSCYAGVEEIQIRGDGNTPTLEEKVACVVAECQVQGNQWQTVLNIHDWLTTHAYYDDTYSFYGAEDVLFRGTGVCDSYTKAFCFLMNRAGITCQRVTSDGHAWNAILLDRKWYHVDVTWDDPMSEPMVYGPVSGYEIHDYFCINDELIYGLLDDVWKTHLTDASFRGSCNSLDMSCPVHEGTWTEGSLYLAEYETLSYQDLILSTYAATADNPFIVPGDQDYPVGESGFYPASYDSVRLKRYYYAYGVTQNGLIMANGDILDVSVTYDTEDLSFSVTVEGIISSGPAEVNGGEVTDGASFAGALSSQDFTGATWVQDAQTGVYTITLDQDVTPKYPIEIRSGTYILTSGGSISRTEGNAGTLIQLNSGTSLTLGGSVAIDGGAVWTGAPTPAAGATNAGITAAGALIMNNGTLGLTGNAVLRNQDNSGNCSTVQGSGTIRMSGGIIRNCKGTYAVACGDNLDFDMSSGEISGNYAGNAVICVRNATVSGGTIRNNKLARTDNSGVFFEPGEMSITGGLFADNDGAVIVGNGNTQSVSITGGTFSGNNPAVRICPTAYNETVKISGAPVFSTESDRICGTAEVIGSMTMSGMILLEPNSYEPGTVAVTGTNDYSLTEADFACFALTDQAPAGANLCLDQQENQILVCSITPILIETAASESVIYDGEPVACGTDFDISVFLYEEEEKGDEITARYTVGGGDISVSFRYRNIDLTGEYTEGLPTYPGTYTVIVSAAADNELFRAEDSQSFELTILPVPILVEAAAVETPVVYDEEPVEKGTDFDIRVFIFLNGEKGMEITDCYTGEEAFSYQYRVKDSTEEWTDGLPTDAGTYVIQVTAGADTARFRDAGTTTFELTITPLWKISFNANGGTGEMDPVRVSDGEDCVLPANEFTRPGHHFTGWRTGERTFEDQGTIENVGADVTLYAQWAEDRLYISLDTYDQTNDRNVAGGQISFELVQQAWDDPYPWADTIPGGMNLMTQGKCLLRLKAIPDEGYMFIGWFVGVTRDAANQTLMPTNELISLNAGCSLTIEGNETRYPICAVFAEVWELELPSNLEGIEEGTFEGVAATIVTVPSGCDSIGDRAFVDSAMSIITLPGNCELGEDVFAGCGKVIVISTEGSYAEQYCAGHANCFFKDQNQD